MLDCAPFWTDTDTLSGLQDSETANGCTNSVQSKRLQVLNVWKEVQLLEEEINKMVSTVTTTVTERCIKDLKVPGDKLSAYLLPLTVTLSYTN